RAADGIRDRDVTGVQTCALPIFREGDFLLLPPEMLHGISGKPETEFITDSFVFRLDMLESPMPDTCTTQFFSPLASQRSRFPVRSEERRVGKEYRACGWLCV